MEICYFFFEFSFFFKRFFFLETLFLVFVMRHYSTHLERISVAKGRASSEGLADDVLALCIFTNRSSVF